MTFALLIEALNIAPNASAQGYPIDSMLEMLHWFMLVLFVGWGSFYAYTLWRFNHKKHPKANYVGTTSHLPTKLEGGVLVLEVILLLSFAAPIWANRVDQFPTGPGVIHIRAVGEQYAWNFQYAGADGKYAPRLARLVTVANPLGVDMTDPAAANNVLFKGEFHIPVNTPVVVDVMSKDVIHDFCIPNMRVATDAIPGTEMQTWFVPIKTGVYDVVCAQLCGNGHSQMRAELHVDSEADYQKWFDEHKPKPAVADAQGATPSTALAASR